MSNNFNFDDAADIRNVNIDDTLSGEERIAEYVRQLNYDPKHYLCGEFKVTAIYPKDASTFEQCIGGLTT
jgi:hypothetical protein